MRNKWLLRGLVISAVSILIYFGYGLWNDFLDSQEELVGAEWVVPLSEDYSYWDNYIRTLENNLKGLGLELVIDYSSVAWNKEDDQWKRCCGIKNSHGELIIPTLYERLDIDLEQGYILAGNYNKNNYHYYNLDGSDFIKGDFQNASMFKNGYACVEKNGQQMVMSTSGVEILKVNSETLINFDSNKGLFEFTEGKHTGYLGYSSLWGLIDINGNVVLEPKYDVIEKKPSENRILVMYTTKDDINQHKVYLDNEYAQVSKGNYKDATAFEGGVAAARDNQGWCIINEQEEIIARIKGCKEMYGFSEGIALAEFANKLKYYDTKGDVIFTIPYKGLKPRLTQEMYYFNEGLIAFPGKNNKIGYMDKKGHVVVKPIFDDVYPVENGEAFVNVRKKAGVIKIIK